MGNKPVVPHQDFTLLLVLVIIIPVAIITVTFIICCTWHHVDRKKMIEANLERKRRRLAFEVDAAHRELCSLRVQEPQNGILQSSYGSPVQISSQPSIQYPNRSPVIRHAYI